MNNTKIHDDVKENTAQSLRDLKSRKQYSTQNASLNTTDSLRIYSKTSERCTNPESKTVVLPSIKSTLHSFHMGSFAMQNSASHSKTSSSSSTSSTEDSSLRLPNLLNLNRPLRPQLPLRDWRTENPTWNPPKDKLPSLPSIANCDFLNERSPGTVASILLSTRLSNSVEQVQPPRRHMTAEIEKIRRRRENHNAVERRRRDHINDLIQELATVVPECKRQDPSVKLNKSFILERTLDYIRELENKIEHDKSSANKVN